MSIRLTSSGEVAEFIGNVNQLEPGETEDACVAFAASMVWHSTAPGTRNPYTPEDIDSMADSWYSQLTGSITNNDGMKVEQLHTMLNGIGLRWEDLPLDHNFSDDEKVRNALRDGKPVLICAAESSFFDVQLGRNPYTWDTSKYNHCLVATGIAPDNNVYVRDTVEVGQAFPPASQRVYDLRKMEYVSLTAVIPSWIRRIITSGLPQGWQDDGTTLKAPNGHTVVRGFREHILKAASWASGDMPLQEEEGRSQVEESNSQLGSGTRQLFNAHMLEFTPARGVFEGYIGQELLYVLTDRARMQTDLQQAQLNAASMQKQIDDLKVQLAGTNQAPASAPAA